MQVLTDAQWAKFEAAIAAAKIRGARPRTEDRRTIEAIIWRLDNGAKWRSIPAELGDWHHARSVAASVEALGRSRGGLGTKIVGVCDAAGRLLDFVLIPGQGHELAPSLTLLRRLPEAPSWALADRACDAKEFRSEVRAMGAIPVVPSRRNAKEPQPCPAYIYRHRNLIERCWS
jgi:transposase